MRPHARRAHLRKMQNYGRIGGETALRFATCQSRHHPKEQLGKILGKMRRNWPGAIRSFNLYISCDCEFGRAKKKKVYSFANKGRLLSAITAARALSLRG